MTEPDLLHHLLANAARQSGTRCALRCGDQVFDYETLWTRSLEVAAGLRARGVRPGDRVLLMMENSAEFATCFFGALACGAMAVPVSPQTREARLAAYRQVRDQLQQKILDLFPVEDHPDF